MKDHYAVLGLRRDASKEDIRQACRILVKKLHADGQQVDETAYRDIQEAYQVLYLDESRARYDALREAAQPVETRSDSGRRIEVEQAKACQVEHSRKAPKKKRFPVFLPVSVILIAVFFGFWLFVRSKGDKPVLDSRQEGLEKFSQGSFQEASDLLEKSGGDERDPEVLLKLGASYYNQRKYDEAIAAYEEVIALDKGNAVIYNGLGNVYRDRKDPDKAIESYRKAIEIDPMSPLAYSNLAILLSDSGKIEEARLVIGQGLEKIPTSQELKNIHSYLTK